ncbi:DNA sulfur modification protein DndD [Vibrio parahaemolyticus]|uniref:DNA sulfur modification protein DndD n=2 Tax=Vibrio parahaemolyticus TaxID=670 RepID=A0AA46L5N2_VIBPH|nr:DNA sulfur modification protein DndD [Vibrio parahaemolyticus]EGR1699530.1 DNA sulfur modification protein DndD [Vibrio parahaemolyticus]EJF4093231.1 DNA sulfur modification protein DndD [Vibrio parahaemolyticus]EJG0302308.1 DNA sulfur modification protein DndD [Vibrio parahaemolyticus]EJG0516011.1 DNA sulfur modification protein DndD [Vibrio parahaemolyticus]EJG1182159.1 DNA sulfur modification protein DndD [Vibrio parahaemolyticus]
MLITKLTLNNFRVFRGEHEILLSPLPAEINAKGTETRSPKPIILFGGLNGAGKTSILTAVRLALFGRQSFSKALNNNEYINALDELIHKGVSQSDLQDKASVSMEFKYTQNGEESLYTVLREWKRGKKDVLTLKKNGVQISELNYEQCQGFLNELIPTGIADLFFFDGEKIADLAEDESGTVLKTAVRRLLGLDIIAKLKSDLAIFLKKHGSEKLSLSVKQELNSLDSIRAKHEENARQLRNKADSIAEEIESTSNDILELENKLSQNGGAWAKTREDEQQKVDSLLKEKVELEKQIRMEMETNLPFALAPNAMQRLQTQIKQEQQIKKKQNFGNELDSFLDTLRSKYPSFDTEKAQSAIADSFKAHVGEFDSAELLLDISDRQANTIDYQLSNLSQESFSRFDEARVRLQNVEEEIDNASNNIARAPEQEQVQELFADVRKLDKKKEKLIIEYHALLEEAKRELRQALETARKIQRLHDKNKDQSNKDQSISNAQNSILLLEKFGEQLTKARVKQLENEFVKSYKKLARKEDLQLSASINPASFDVELVDEHGIKINRKAMSAGEKQIYAISILEALGRTSGRKLPIIIDTPLGRLDSHHRDKLVENYFPTASHQVVILSTDTEIDRNYTRLIQDDIARTYEICFDGTTKSSTLKEGYFWRETTKEAV